jgi:ribose transport system permease protein
VLVSFVLAGVIAGLAGLVQVSRQGSGVPTNGLDQIIAAFAATYLGANAIKPGRFNVLGTVVGLLFVASLVNGLSLLGVAGWVKPVVYGGSLVAAMTVTAYFQRRLASGKAI